MHGLVTIYLLTFVTFQCFIVHLNNTVFYGSKKSVYFFVSFIYSSKRNVVQ